MERTDYHAQKFQRGDLVHIRKEMPAGMSHFEGDLDAVILGSYEDQYGGGNIKDYQVIFVSNGSTCAWYQEELLTLVGHVGERGIRSLKCLFDERHPR